MAFNLGGFGAAGGGADMLQQILATAFKEQLERKRLKQDDRRLDIDQQRANNDDELRRIALQDRSAAQADLSKSRAQTGAGKLAGNLRIGQELNPDAIETLTAGDLGDTVKGATLPSRNIGQGMTSTPNPGKGPSYLGTAGQQEDRSLDTELDRQITLTQDPGIRGRLTLAKTLDRDKRSGAITEVMRESAKPDTKPLYRIGRDGKPTQTGELPANAVTVNEPAPTQGGAPRGLSPTAEANLTSKLAGEWSKASAGTKEIARQHSLMMTGLDRVRNGDINGGSQAVLITFQKILDPTSVVRETEYARSAEGLSVLRRMEGYMERLAKGGAGVPAAELEAMVQTASQFVANTKSSTVGTRKRIAAFADKYNIPHELVFDDDDTPNTAPATGGAGAKPAGGVKILSIKEIKP